ncbi:cyclophilin peptidyl-prolyl cis-trans isomerase Cyp8 [Coemansia interrupta]|uniref:Cyclophilin peptidyl-prolyl cis-trans isomerase Cyp8 n=1 Tax=Coemansia interrupta TaxID=1126814 RepID=A0A9W8HLT1_9FUNG|nr:cyclophilin peptidyl-prolyl cis-trans isomerase Cyp8 [Coemansia interrupta]
MQFGGKQMGVQGKKETAEDLPVNCCMLSLKPFVTPVCTPDGYVFETDNIKKYIAEHHKHPFSGKPLESGDLVKLHYHKNAKGDLVDPISFRQLSRHTKIVTNRKSGHVYSWASVDEFNKKPNAWADLISGEPFAEDDVIVLQDPDAPKKLSKATSGSSNAAQQVAPASSDKPVSKEKKPYNAASYTKGLAAASLTSTAMEPVTSNERQLIEDEEYMFGRIKEKGYARIVTNLGEINLELHCDRAPRTCYNFIQLAKSGYYKGVKFHRSIRNFMIQGGDPTGTGRGGRSFWGKDFADEISKKLKHTERGVLSMANRGPGTNGSQFFILYRATSSLDGKHTVFGRAVGGLSVLDKMEAVPTDDSDRPTTDIVIRDVTVFVDPYAEFGKRIERKIEHEKDQRDLESGKRKRTAAEEMREEDETTTWLGTKLPSKQKSKTGSAGGGADSAESSMGVGKYMNVRQFEELKKMPRDSQGDSQAHPNKKKKAVGYTFGDFAGW